MPVIHAPSLAVSAPVTVLAGRCRQWLIRDYQVAYECFIRRRGESLLIAGRCSSAEHEAMASARGHHISPVQRAAAR